MKLRQEQAHNVQVAQKKKQDALKKQQDDLKKQKAQMAAKKKTARRPSTPRRN